MISLVKEIMAKIQFKYNNISLDAVDDDDDFESQTEWAAFLHASIEIIAKISEILPDETFEFAYKLFDENLNAYHELRHFIVKEAPGQTPRLRIPSGEAQLNEVICSLRDCGSALRIVGRLAPIFTHENFSIRYSSAKTILERVLSSLIFSNQNRLYHEQVPALADALVNVHSQLVATIHSFTFWLSQMSNETSANTEREFTALITNAIDLNVEVIVSQNASLYPQKVVHSSIYCLLSLVNVVRPRIVLNLVSVQTLFNKVFNSVREAPQLPFISNSTHNALSMQLTRDDEFMLMEMVSKTLLLPWYNVADTAQEWHTRAQHHDSFITKLLGPLYTYADLSTVNSTNEVVLKILLQRDIPLLTHIVNSHRYVTLDVTKVV